MLEFKKSHKYFTQLSMVCKSVAKESVRFALANVQVDDKYIVGTDGKRMACLSNFGIAPGSYKVAKATKSLIWLVPDELVGNFPKYTDLLPETVREDDKSVLDLDLSVAHYRLAKAGICINIAFLKDYMTCEDYHVISSNRPVAFYMPDFVAIVMPINGD